MTYYTGSLLLYSMTYYTGSLLLYSMTYYTGSLLLHSMTYYTGSLLLYSMTYYTGRLLLYSMTYYTGSLLLYSVSNYTKNYLDRPNASAVPVDIDSTRRCLTFLSTMSRDLPCFGSGCSLLYWIVTVSWDKSILELCMFVCILEVNKFT